MVNLDGGDVPQVLKHCTAFNDISFYRWNIILLYLFLHLPMKIRLQNHNYSDLNVFSTVNGQCIRWAFNKLGLLGLSIMNVLLHQDNARVHTYSSSEICTGAILALLRSRLLADTWFQDWGCTMPVLRQPSARYQLSTTGISPCLQLMQYCAVCEYWHQSDFPTWVLF